MPRELRRKEDVPDDARTPQKDAAAAFVEREIIDKDRWPMEFTEMAQLSDEKAKNGGWSRQHFSNTISDYFKEIDEERAQAAEFDDMFEAYRQGYRDGFRDARSEQ